MLVATFPATGASIEKLFGSQNWFDDQVLEDERHRLEDGCATEVGGVGNTYPGPGFRDAFFRLVARYLDPIDYEVQKVMRRHLDILGTFAVQPHNDYGIDDYRERWLLVLQCGKGYTFKGFGPEGHVSIPLKAGQLIAFDEWRDHQVDIDDPDRAKIRKANYFLTVPNPDFIDLEMQELAEIEFQ